jgi:hypothetical protein
VRWVMIASAFTDGVSIDGFYAMQPYPRRQGDDDALKPRKA